MKFESWWFTLRVLLRAFCLVLLCQTCHLNLLSVAVWSTNRLPSWDFWAVVIIPRRFSQIRFLPSLLSWHWSRLCPAAALDRPIRRWEESCMWKVLPCKALPRSWLLREYLPDWQLASIHLEWAVQCQAWVNLLIKRSFSHCGSDWQAKCSHQNRLVSNDQGCFYPVIWVDLSIWVWIFFCNSFFWYNWRLLTP